MLAPSVDWAGYELDGHGLYAPESSGLGGSWQQDLQGCVLGGAIGGAASVTGGREAELRGPPGDGPGLGLQFLDILGSLLPIFLPLHKPFFRPVSQLHPCADLGGHSVSALYFKGWKTEAGG